MSSKKSKTRKLGARGRKKNEIVTKTFIGDIDRLTNLLVEIENTADTLYPFLAERSQIQFAKNLAAVKDYFENFIVVTRDALLNPHSYNIRELQSAFRYLAGKMLQLANNVLKIQAKLVNALSGLKFNKRKLLSLQRLYDKY